jgi:glutathione S-transferase
MPMNLLGRLPPPPMSPALEADIRRIVAIWKNATRFRTYGIHLARFGDDGTAAAYATEILALPAMAEWTEAAKIETGSQKAPL